MLIDPDLQIKVTEPSASRQTIACDENGAIDYSFYDHRARRIRAADFRLAGAVVLAGIAAAVAWLTERQRS
jgi:hypothetical protein